MKFKKSLVSVLSTATFLSSICGASAFAKESDEIGPAEETYEATQNPNMTSHLDEFTFDGKKIQSSTDTSKLKLDLFEGNNLNTALLHGLEFIVSEDSSPYVDDKESVTKTANENKLIKESMQSTIDYIKNHTENNNDNNLEIFKRLHTIEIMLKSEKSTNNNPTVLKFISSMKSAYQTILSRSVAKQILDDNRDKIESKMSSETYSASADATSTIPQEGFNIGIFSGISTNQQTAETSFYKIDNSGSLGVSIGTGLNDYLSANASCAFGITNSIIFYSLEEFLDSGMDKGNISFLKLKDDDLKKIILSRKQMQSDENEILVKIKTSIEPFLKSSGIIPQNLAFKMPEPTYLGTSERKLGINAKSKLAAEASCLEHAGMNISTDASVHKIKSYHPYLDLIDENLFITDYFDNVDDLIKYLKTSKTAKYKYIKELAETGINKDELKIIIQNLTGSLKEYNSLLTIIADNNSSTDEIENARDKKKNIERDWIGSDIQSKSKLHRESMLKTAITIGAYLRSLDTEQGNKELFSPLYDEIKNLSLLQKFTSKLFFKSYHNTFSTSRVLNTESVTGEANFDIPLTGKTSLSVTYSDTESPLYTENSQDVDITAKLPIVHGKLYGSGTLKEQFKKYIKAFSDRSESVNKLLADCFMLMDKEFDNVVSDHKLEKQFSVPSVVAVKDYVTMKFLLTKIPKTTSRDLTALPGCELLTKEKDEMVLKQTKRIDSKNVDISLLKNTNGYGVSVNAGKSSSRIGSDSLIYLTNKFNTSKLGQSLTEKNSLWDKFKESQREPLGSLITNIANEKSNARYELQGIYSAIVKNIKTASNTTKEEKRTLLGDSEKLFREFLDSCEEFKKSDTEESKAKNYEQAISGLDTILALNYKQVWIKALAAANK
ncbi:MAG: hypothetical protein Q4D57_04095 [Clostridia bacterium]|nr:hypothetical protein [Clostridia bacterium]